MTIPVLSVVGFANSGKTTFLEGLLPYLRQQGIKVAVFKHHGHIDSVGEDVQGKDTDRLKKAGAEPVGLVKGKNITTYHSLAQAPEPKDFHRYVPEVDLIITEGFKRADNPKIEIWRHPDQAEPACSGDPNLIALVTDHRTEVDLPVFGLTDFEKVALFIITYFQLKQV